MSTKPNYRYPGIRSFEAADQNLFFGRSDDIRGLYAYVKTQSLVVLFSKSGIGKSSLLNAGLVPLFSLEPIVPVKVRLQDVKISPVKAVKNALQPYLDPVALQRYTDQDFEEAGLWECLRACRFERFGDPATPVLLFDQFEEFFLHPLENWRPFLLDLADLISQRLPNRIREHLLSIPVEQRSDDDMNWHQAPNIKVVIAIRSDRLSLLDELSTEIPLILQNRYHLKPLLLGQAQEAIKEPAALTGTFATPPFSFKEQTLQLILGELTNANQEIESFQLQLICQHLEQQIQQRLKNNTGQALVVDETYVSNRDDIRSIINDYYEQSIKSLALSPELEERARDFIETGLIVGRRRVGITEGVEKAKYKIEDSLLEKLIDKRLIRVENTHLGRSYEISHDALVEPILQSYEERRKRLEKAETEKNLRERQQQLAEELERRTRDQQLANERRLRRLSLMFAAVAGTLAVIATGALFLATTQAKKTKEQYNVALYNYNTAQEALSKYKDSELKLLGTRVDVYLAANQLKMAKKAIEEVRQDSTLSKALIRDTILVAKEMAIIKQLEQLQQ